MENLSSEPVDVRRLESLVREVAEQIDAIRGEFTDAVWEAERVLREIRHVGEQAALGEPADPRRLQRMGEDAADAREGLKMSFTEAMSAARMAECQLTELRAFAARAIELRRRAA